MKNNVELLGHYGSDQIIAQSAWTSTSRELSQEKIERIPKLIVSLWADGHETPFEKATVHFMVNCDIASHIHLLKHRLSSLNGESARYKELKEDKYYLPRDWHEIYPAGDVSQIGLDWMQILQDYATQGNRLYHQCLQDLTPVLGRKRAKESARFFKTYNSQIESDVMFNLRSFANFLQLRNSEHAQLEIREIAAEMQRLVEAIDDAPFQFALGVIIKANELWVDKRKEVNDELMKYFFES